jgi:hypothetical protein
VIIKEGIFFKFECSNINIDSNKIRRTILTSNNNNNNNNNHVLIIFYKNKFVDLTIISNHNYYR